MRTRDLGIVGFGVSACAFAIFAIGGATRWSQAGVAVLIAASIAFTIPSRRVPSRVSPLVGFIVIALGLTAFQLVPLPHAVLELLSPVGVGLRDDGAALLGFSSWQALSLDVPGSLRAIAFFSILLAVAIVSLRLAATERGRYRIVAAVGVLTALCALVVGAHELLGLKRLYGVYEIQHATPRILGPLLNENHLGGLMAIGTIVNIGLAFFQRQPTWARVGFLVFAAACGATTVATSSRGATIGLLLGVVTLLALLAGQRLSADSTRPGRRQSFATKSLPIGIVGACAVIVVIYSSAGRVEQQLSVTSLDDVSHPRSKYAAWRSAEALIEESPWVGIGRGAFESNFTRAHPASGLVTFSHLENEYLQSAVDWGIPGTISLALAALWFLSVALRRWRSGPLAAAAIAALIAIACQSVVDFGIELLGLAVPLTAIAATLTFTSFDAATPKCIALARGARAVLCVSLLACAVLLFSRRTTTLDADHRSLDRNATMADVRDVLQRHPLDYYGYFVAAQLSRGEPKSIEYLNHALILHPTHAGLHHFAATLLLATHHPEQAAIEYTSAMRTTPTPVPLLRELIKKLSKDQAVSAIPVDFPDPLEITRTLQEEKRIDIATAWLAHVLQINPRNSTACELLYKIALDAHDLDAAEVAGRSCLQITPDRQTRLALAHVVMNKNGYDEAVRLLADVESWDGRIDEKFDGWLLVCDAQTAATRYDDAERCLHRLDAAGLAGKDRVGAISSRLDTLREQRRLQRLGSGSSAGSNR